MFHSLIGIKVITPSQVYAVWIYPSLFQALTFRYALRAPGNMVLETTQGIFPQIYLLEGVIPIVLWVAYDNMEQSNWMILGELYTLFHELWLLYKY